MRNLVYISLILLALFISSCDQLSDKQQNPLNFIPMSSPLILETNNLTDVWDTYAQSSIWAVRKDNPAFNHIYSQMQHLRLLATKNQKIASTLSQNKCLFAITIDKDFKANLMLAAPTSLSFSDIEQVVQNDYGTSASIVRGTHHDIPLHQVVFSDRDAVLYFTIYKGVILISYDNGTIKEALDQLIRKKSLKNDAHFVNIRKTSGKHSDATLYINTKNISKLLLSGTYSRHTGLIEPLDQLAGWSALDLSAKKDKIILNGFTKADSSDYLDSFTSEASSFPFATLIPSSTAVVVAQNFNSGMAQYQQLVKRRNINAIISKFKLDKNLFKHLTGKQALLLDPASAGSFRENTSAIFVVDDGPAALQGIENIAEATGRPYYDKTGEDGKRILRIPSDNLFKELFGNLYSNLSSPYVTIHEDLLIASASLNHLLETLRKTENNDVLANDDTFKTLSTGLSGKGNIMVYANMHHSLNMASAINDRIKNSYRQNTTALENFAGFTMEFSYTPDYFFTAMYASSGEKLRAVKESSWELSLDAEVVGSPQIVEDHLSTEKRIIAFDALNNMYFISHDGKILWKHTLSGRPLGKVQQVDAFNNNKVQYLLNTENHLYLIDVLGRDVDNFPVKLDSKATNGVAVFRYNGYRLMFAGADQKIYNYDIDGEKVAGWDTPRAPGEVVTPLQHLRFAGRDYLFATAKNGKLLIVDRRGEVRVNIRDQIVNAYHSRIFINKTNSKAPFITTGISGALKYIKLNGRTDETTFEQFSNDHYFFYERFNDDRYYDFIYFDKGRVVIYDRFQNVLFEKDFGNHVFTAPEITTYKKATAITFTSLSEEKFYVITKEGLLEEVAHVKATTPCAVGDLKRYGKTSVVAGQGEKLSKYILSD